MKKPELESQIVAQIRKLNEQMQKLRVDLRAMVRQPKRNDGMEKRGDRRTDRDRPDR